MQFLNVIAIVHAMAGNCGMHKLYVHYLEQRRWTHIEVYSTLLPVHTRTVGVSQLC